MFNENDALELLLKELRAFREDLKEFRDTVTSWHNDHTGRLSALEVQMKAGVTGNGTPSRLALAESRIESLIKYKYWLIGAAAGVSTLVSALLILLFK